MFNPFTQFYNSVRSYCIYNMDVIWREQISHQCALGYEKQQFPKSW